MSVVYIDMHSGIYKFMKLDQRSQMSSWSVLGEAVHPMSLDEH